MTRGTPVSSISGLSGLIIKARWLIITFWCLSLAMALPLATELKDHLVVSGEIKGGEASTVRHLLAEKFSGVEETVFILVASNIPDVDREAAPLMRQLLEDISSFDWVSDVTSYYSTRERYLLAHDRDGLLVLVSIEGTIKPLEALAQLEDFANNKVSTIRETHPNATIRWTGDEALKADIVKASNRDLRTSELRALPLSFLLLLLAFGALVASVMPIAVAVMSVVMTLAGATLLSNYMDISIMVQSVATLLGLALGIDYSLIMISRFREAKVRSGDLDVAIAEAISQGGRTILISGCAVAIGFCGLAIVPLDQMRSIALGGVLVTSFSILLATTFLPICLYLLDERVNFLSLPTFSKLKVQSSGWQSWSKFIVKRPILILIVAGIPLIYLASNSDELSLAFPQDTWLPAKAESVLALDDLDNMRRGGAPYRLQILYELPENLEPLEEEGWETLLSVVKALSSDKRLVRVISIFSETGYAMPVELVREKLSEVQLRRYISTDNKLAFFEVIPHESLSSQDIAELVRDLRVFDHVGETGVKGSWLIGGLPAGSVDFEDVIEKWFPFVIMGIVLASFIVLVISFRSVLIPIKAILLNILAVLAAYGVLVLVFGEGYGISFFGLSEPIAGVFPNTPVLVFCAAFGISMDYEVFLLSRIQEARKSTDDEKSAIVKGISKTGPLITNAALIMIVVFGAFSFGEILPTQLLGFALAVVVALDAFLIRVALGPAAITLAGRWNWWPGSRGNH